MARRPKYDIRKSKSPIFRSGLKVSASSHMVGFDVPHVTNDMILRFMDVDVSLVAGQAASSKSRVGDDERVYLGLISSLAGAGVPLLKGGNTDWECKQSISVWDLS
jgi:carboxypeptidase D